MLDVYQINKFELTLLLSPLFCFDFDEFNRAEKRSSRGKATGEGRVGLIQPFNARIEAWPTVNLVLRSDLAD